MLLVVSNSDCHAGPGADRVLSCTFPIAMSDLALPCAVLLPADVDSAPSPVSLLSAMSINWRIVSWPLSHSHWTSRPHVPEVERDDTYIESTLLQSEFYCKAEEIFRGPVDLIRLRAASGWIVWSTPGWATHKEFSRGHHSGYGISAEALALTFLHMSSVEHMRGDDIERYWHAVNYYFEIITYVHSIRTLAALR